MYSGVTRLALVALLVLMSQGSFGAFQEDPMNTTCVLGIQFLIQCRPPLGYSARWVYNNSRVLQSHPPQGLTPTVKSGLYKMTLTCETTRHYTTIQCVAISVWSSEEEPSQVATIKVQGMPDRVRNLHNASHPSIILLTWDMASVNATYCVSVRVSRAGREAELNNETCGVQVSSFPLHREDGGQYSNLEDIWYIFTVSAVSSIGRGPPSYPLRTNFYSGLPDKINNISYAAPIASGVNITWTSLGPGVSYCIQIFNSSTKEPLRDESCSIEESFFIWNTTCLSDLPCSYDVQLTAVSQVGRGLPSSFFTIIILPDDNGMKYETTTSTFAAQRSLSKEAEIIISTLASITIFAVVLIILLVAIFMFYKSSRHRKSTEMMSMSHCGAYESGYVDKLGNGMVADLEPGSQQYEIVRPIASGGSAAHGSSCASQQLANLDSDDKNLKLEEDRCYDNTAGSEPIYSRIT